MDAAGLIEQVTACRDMMTRCGLQSLPLYLTEWDLTRRDDTQLNDSCIKAARMVHFIAQLHDVVELAIYDCLSDLSCAVKDQGPLPGARGLLTRHGLRKPAYYAVSYMQFSGEMLLKKGDHYFLTARGRNHFWGMCYHDCEFGVNFHFRKAQKLSYRELPTLFDENPTIHLDFTLLGVPNGDYCINLCRPNEETSVLGILNRIGDQSLLNTDNCDYLKRMLQPQDIQLVRGCAADNTLSFSVTLQPNDMVVMDIYPIHLER